MKNQTKLKTTLLANAAFSGISGLSMLFFHQPIAQKMGIPDQQFLIGMGAGLLIFALLVVFVALRKISDSKWVGTIIFQDGLWVFGSMILLFVNPEWLTGFGKSMIFLVAILVAIFGGLQFLILKKAKQD